LLASVGRTLDAFFPPIAERLRSTGFSVFAASGTESHLVNWTELTGFSQRPSLGFLSAVPAVRRWVRDCRLDVVVTSTATASAIARVAGLPTPVIYFCHGLHWERGSSLRARPWQLIETALLRRTASVITLNTPDEEWFREQTTKPVFRLPYGVGVPLARYPRVPVPDGDLELLWVGDFSARKRPLDALAVLRLLVERGVPVRLRMLGDGPLRARVLEEVDATGLGSVVMAGGRGDVAAALGSATALLHTAAWEGLPRVALEAAAVGRWCYGFDVKGLRDAPLVRLAPDGDIAGLAALISHDHAAAAMQAVPDVRERLDVTAAADLIGRAIAETVAAQP
jgi:glycosyltransferase involved in cell wall biosynthesis